jgi:hypothetical protein
MDHLTLGFSLLAWIDSYELRYGAPTEDELVLTRPPPRAVPPHHNGIPSQVRRRVSKDGFVDEATDSAAACSESRAKAKLPGILKGRSASQRGRKWDHLRSAEPVIVSGHLSATPGSPWRTFVHSSEYGHLPNEEAEIVDVEVLDKLQPGFNIPVDIPRAMDTRKKRGARTAAMYKRVWNLILEHPLVPLGFRLTVLLTSILALALSAEIYQSEGGQDVNTSERTQAIVAIVVDTLAIPYICYMTWDEYTGKPLGLRRPIEKISLILMDLFFIIFKSASTSLAFESLVYHNSPDTMAEHYSRALAAFQTVGLISWTMTFTVNVFRLVQRLGGSDEDNSRMWAGHG